MTPQSKQVPRHAHPLDRYMREAPKGAERVWIALLAVLYYPERAGELPEDALWLPAQRELWRLALGAPKALHGRGATSESLAVLAERHACSDSAIWIASWADHAPPEIIAAGVNLLDAHTARRRAKAGGA